MLVLRWKSFDAGAEVEEPAGRGVQVRRRGTSKLAPRWKSLPMYWSKDWFLKHGLFNSMKTSSS